MNTKPRLFTIKPLDDFKGNEKMLLKEMGYKTIHDAKKAFKEETKKANDIYYFLLQEYNKQIERENKLSKKNYMEKNLNR